MDSWQRGHMGSGHWGKSTAKFGHTPSNQSGRKGSKKVGIKHDIQRTYSSLFSIYTYFTVFLFLFVHPGSLALEMQKFRNLGGKVQNIAPRNLRKTLALPTKESCAVKKLQRRLSLWGQRQKRTVCSHAKRSLRWAARLKICPTCQPQRCIFVVGTNLLYLLCMRLPPKRRKRWPVSGLLM